MQWVWLSLIGSFMNACVIHVNHHFKVDGLTISVYKNLYALLFSLVLLPFIDWDLEPTFYIAWTIIGFLSVFVDVGVFNAAAKFGSRLTSLYMPVRILVGFFVWFVFDPEYLDILLAQPLNFMGIIGCLLLSCFAIYMLRNNDASWQAFRTVAQIGVIFVVIDVLVKSVMEGQVNLVNATMASVVVLFASTFVFAALATRLRQGVYLPKAGKKGHKACLILAALFCILIPSLNAAQATTPNPAYMSAVMLTAIVWLMLFHKLAGVKDDGSPWAALAFVASAAGIVLLSN